MDFQKLFCISVLILCSNVFMASCAPTGVAVFNSTLTGLNGTITLRQNPALGTYLIGQIRNISCFNASSATLNPKDVAPVNSCMLGMTINNWRNDSFIFRQDVVLDREWRQTIFNLSNIKLPDIREILNGSYNPFPNLFANLTTPTTTSAPNAMAMPSTRDNCANVGEVYNPRRDIFSGLFGFLTPPGLIGNLMVSNGTGSILMGPLELLTAGPTSVIGLPLVLWMDAIRPVVNGSTISLDRGASDRILDCSVIRASPSL